MAGGSGSPLPRTQAEIVQLGDYCEVLMRHGSFNTLCETFKHAAFNNAMATSPAETPKREAIYSDVWGLQQFLGHMKSYVMQRDNINAAHELQDAEDNEEPDDQPDE